jgi:hypothetical protein
VSIVLLGDLSFVKEGAHGLLVVTINEQEVYHEAVSIDPNGNSEPLSDGAEAKIDQAIVGMVRAAFEKPEEEKE